MGLYDESWCTDCGKSQPYSPDDVVCGDCTSEAYESRSTKLIEYMKLHLISLEKDKESLDKEYTDSYDYVVNEGQIIATRHLLSVAADIIFIKTEED
mgnify:CR=1 FL=1